MKRGGIEGDEAKNRKAGLRLRPDGGEERYHTYCAASNNAHGRENRLPPGGWGESQSWSREEHPRATDGRSRMAGGTGG